MRIGEMTERIVPRKEVKKDYLDHVLISDHPIIEDKNGIFRYKAKPMMIWLCDQIDLNVMWRQFQYGTFSRDEFMQFYRDIGYSLCGFEEVWGGAMDNILGIKRDYETGKEISRKSKKKEKKE